MLAYYWTKMYKSNFHMLGAKIMFSYICNISTVRDIITFWQMGMGILLKNN